MGQERDVLPTFVRDGRPIALGLHVIGDARCQTNSLYAWGSHLALNAPATLVDVMAEHAGDPEAQALALDARIGEEVAGRHALSLARDRALRRASAGEERWDAADGGEGFIHSVVVPAAADDPAIFRAVMRREFQLDPVGALVADTAMLARARALAPGGRAPDGPPTPTRVAVHDLIGPTLAAR
jgi:hypothetical protein